MSMPIPWENRSGTERSKPRKGVFVRLSQPSASEVLGRRSQAADEERHAFARTQMLMRHDDLGETLDEMVAQISGDSNLEKEYLWWYSRAPIN